MLRLPEPAVALTDVSRLHRTAAGEVGAVAGVTLRIDEGESVAVTGPSGSGKTTLLNLIAGLDRPTAGEVTVLGTALTAASERQLTAFRARSVGLVFQEPHLLPGLTALENVVAARLPWAPWRALEPEARGLLDAVGLGARMDHAPARLSGGERQRVGIARALLGRPRLLLADEPSGNLDIAATEAILALLADLRRERDLTLVVATHDPAVAAIAGRVVRLVGGRLVEDRRLAGEGLAPVRELER